MSTILKALRRLEEERAATEEPRPLREQIATAARGAERPPRRGWLAAAGALVLGAATGGALIWWLFGTPAAAPVVAAAVPTPAPQVPAPAPVIPVPAPPEPAAVPGPPDQAFASDVEIVDRPEALPMVADSEPVQPGPAQPKPGQVRPVESSAAAERARQAALAEYNAAERARRGLPPEVASPIPPAPAEPIPVLPPAESVAAQPPPTPAPEAAPAPVAPAEPPAPAPVAQAPAPEVAAAQPAPKPAARKPAAAKPAPRKVDTKPAPSPAPPAPEVSVSVAKTQWHPLADRRIAWLRVPGDSEPRRVVEGDVIDGLLIAQIEPSGVVFERNGEKIRRPLSR